jgi:glycosyltransferase involved in cell wall biosynthesis
MLGGAQSSTHDLALGFARHGHDVAVLGGLQGDGWLGIRSRISLKLGRRSFVQDSLLGYPVFRAWFAWQAAGEVATYFKPDVAILQSQYPVKLAVALEGTPVRRFIYLRNAEADAWGGDPSALKNVEFIANSQFTALWFESRCGIAAPVVYPIVAREEYATKVAGLNVTFINPHPQKGVDLAIEVARLCPEIKFCFVRSWGLSQSDQASLDRQLATVNNVSLMPPTRDMKSVYANARIVLAPSRWEEAFGRVAAEAHINGIPVVGSRRGGLPEAIGPGGMIIEPDAPASVWAEAVRRLWHDEAFWTEKSEAAKAYSLRPEMNPDKQIQRLLQILGGSPS